ncbi:acyltransferase family protein [Altererythrobacter sp. B11]|uniref:acyltransferase family protein n=1 Tax=Altererythrobacter sp. B11 TaxID=2060312 RepID=UPI001558626E|nr:acyltransferase family protein [Altererythrobacter sp. B11]
MRAIAVWSVVLFHTELGIVSGGFVGVDVFFVISGYLITGILLREQAEGRFSLLDFYERRVRRIFPALFAMLAICSIAALVLMLPADLRDYGQNLAGASGSVSNFTLLAQVDYFDGDAKLKPLLHTWSLGIEEQFYLFWPMLLLLVHRSRALFLTACGAVAAISFGGNLWFLAKKPDEVFYLLPFRAWELLLGGMVAAGVLPILRSVHLAGVAAAAGLALIVYAIVAFSDRMAFPGAAALAPCVGAGLVIWAGRDCSRNVVARLLAAPALVFSGKISYSLYLWHWPVFAFLRYRMIEEPGAVLMLLLLPLTFLCAMLSWHYVERPFRTKRWLPTRRGALLGGAVAVICGVALGSALHMSRGLPGRFPAEVNRLAMQGEETDPFKMCSWRSDYGPHCVIGNPAKVDAMLWGDSHAGTLWAAVEPVSALAGVQYAANSACPPGLELATSAACLNMNRADLRFALDHPEVKVVILAARWSLYLKGRALGLGPAETNAGLPRLRWSDGRPVDASTPAATAAMARDLGRLVAQLLAAGKTVVIVYPVPEVGYDVPFTLARLEQRGEVLDGFVRPLGLYLGRQREAFQMLDALGTHPGLRRVYPQVAICPDNDRCLTNLAGRSLYSDSNHLSPVGARMLSPLIAEALR